VEEILQVTDNIGRVETRDEPGDISGVTECKIFGTGSSLGILTHSLSKVRDGDIS